MDSIYALDKVAQNRLYTQLKRGLSYLSNKSAVHYGFCLILAEEATKKTDPNPGGSKCKLRRCIIYM